jgi:hypothetical protein
MITLHAKAGTEAELARVIAQHWQTAERLKMVRDTPHLTLRSAQGGQTDFVEIMTWRDAGVPDWGLGAFGEAGVDRGLEILQGELKLVMGNCGTRTVADITREYVTRA